MQLFVTTYHRECFYTDKTEREREREREDGRDGTYSS